MTRLKRLCPGNAPTLIPICLLLSMGHGTTARAQLYVSSLFSHEVFDHDPESGVRNGSGAFVTAALAGLDRPHGILDTPGGILVASFGSHEVKRYSRTTGAFIDNFIPGTAGLDLPVYLAHGPGDGHLYVSSQGNEQILRFDHGTGAAIDESPFISGGQLDGPSGFDWSPDGSVLFVAGRYSGNVLAYDAGTGAPLATGHVFTSGLSNGDTFGLAVHRASGDLFVASGGQVHRFTAAGAAVTAIDVPGLEIGLEKGPDGESVYVASNNNLYRIATADNSVTGPLLSGSVISTLNFFHFSSARDHQVDRLESSLIEVAPGDRHLAVEFTLSKKAFDAVATLEFTGDYEAWTEGASYRPNGVGIDRIDSANSTSVSMVESNGLTIITERDSEPATGHPLRVYRVRVDVAE